VNDLCPIVHSTFQDSAVIRVGNDNFQRRTRRNNASNLGDNAHGSLNLIVAPGEFSMQYSRHLFQNRWGRKKLKPPF
jgi:hypothetical protein